MKIEIHNNPYTAAESTHAIVIDITLLIVTYNQPMTGVLLCSRTWIRYENIYERMIKPSFIFDDHKILNHEILATIGF